MLSLCAFVVYSNGCARDVRHRLLRMLTVLSPAKALDFKSALPTKKHSQPRLLDQSEQLIEVMRQQSPQQVGEMMGISEDLADLNVQRYADWMREHDKSNARPAVLAFNGGVYQGLQAGNFDARDFTEAQKTVRILSGLYGVLRPLDLIQPYRLEMGTSVETDRGFSLYDWWGSQVTDMVREDLDDSPGADVLVNLASNEYASVLDLGSLGARVVTPRFEDVDRHGRSRVMGLYAKRARGLMAGWAVRNRLRSPGKLLDFAEEGYRYDEQRSTKDGPVFVRPREASPSRT